MTTNVAIAAGLVPKIHALDPNGAYLYSPAERATVTNACLVRMFVAFEEFLEAGFGHFLMGGASTTGWTATTYASPSTLVHAHDMVQGMQRFTDWSTPSTVSRLAGLFFDGGEPFASALASATQDLQDLKTARNGAAHVSRTTQAAIDALHTRWTGTGAAGISTYDLLLAPHVTSSTTFLDHSRSTLVTVATAIANYT